MLRRRRGCAAAAARRVEKLYAGRAAPRSRRCGRALSSPSVTEAAAEGRPDGRRRLRGDRPALPDQRLQRRCAVAARAVCRSTRSRGSASRARQGRRRFACCAPLASEYPTQQVREAGARPQIARRRGSALRTRRPTDARSPASRAAPVQTTGHDAAAQRVANRHRSRTSGAPCCPTPCGSSSSSTAKCRVPRRAHRRTRSRVFVDLPATRAGAGARRPDDPVRRRRRRRPPGPHRASSEQHDARRARRGGRRRATASTRCTARIRLVIDCVRSAASRASAPASATLGHRIVAPTAGRLAPTPSPAPLREPPPPQRRSAPTARRPRLCRRPSPRAARSTAASTHRRPIVIDRHASADRAGGRVRRRRARRRRRCAGSSHGDAVAAATAPTADAARVAADEPSPAGFSMARQLGLGVSRIVIDPGHGGHDPGATGKRHRPKRSSCSTSRCGSRSCSQKRAGRRGRS